MTCEICLEQPATVKAGPIEVCPACRVLVQEEADRRLALVIDAMTRMSEESAA